MDPLTFSILLFLMQSLIKDINLLFLMGGVKINTNAQVINESEKVIDGLYAAGEVIGGVHGANRLGGNAVADITTFGRIAGENATRTLQK